MKRALVTGHAGFLGRHFASQLELRDFVVRGIDPRAVWTWGVPNDALRVFTTYGLREQFDLVIHCAAQSPHRKAIDQNPFTAAYNQLLDASMFTWAIRTQQPRVLYVSSSAVYSDGLVNAWGQTAFKERDGFFGEPFDVYGETKRSGERLAAIANQCGVKTTVIRPFSGYGHDQSEDFPFGAFLRRAIKREDPFVVWGDADQQRDFVHVDDIVNGALKLVDEEVTTPVNICTGEATSMRDLAHLFIREVEYESYVSVDPDAPLGVRYRVGDPSLLHQFYRPRWSIEAGVAQAVREALNGSK